MKTHSSISSVLLGVVLLYACLPCTATEADAVKDHEITLTKGQYEIELRNYDAAIGYLKKALELKPGDHTTMVSLGIAYSRAEQYPPAKELLEKVVAADPQNARARYELGVVLAHMKQYGEANRLLATVSALTANEDLTDHAKELVEGMQPRQKGPQPSLNLAAGLQYDSNVILEPNSPVTPRGSQGDWRGILSLAAAYPFLQTETRGAEARYQFYQSLHSHLEDYNVQQHDLSLGGKYHVAKDAAATVHYGFVTAYVGGEHYSVLHRLRIGIGTALTESSRTAVIVDGEDRRYLASKEFSENADRSAVTFSALLRHTLLFSRETSVTIEYGFQHDDASADTWDVTGNKGAVTGRSMFGKFAVFCSAALSDWTYGPSPVPFYPDRHDRRWDLTAGVYRDLTRTVRVSLANQHVWNDSNIDTYLYERNIVGLFAEVRL